MRRNLFIVRLGIMGDYRRSSNKPAGSIRSRVRIASRQVGLDFLKSGNVVGDVAIVNIHRIHLPEAVERRG